MSNTKIEVNQPLEKNSNSFQVTLKEGSSELSYQVTIPEAFYQKLSGGKVSKEDCLKASFRFLLDRESKESILRKFDLPLIGHYFPEYEKEFKNYL